LRGGGERVFVACEVQEDIVGLIIGIGEHIDVGALAKVGDETCLG